MDVLYEASFVKDLKQIKDKRLLKRVQKVIDSIKMASTPNDLANMKKLQGFDAYYRIRLGNYRIGAEMVSDQIILVRILHRKEIYRRFP